jgi:hypothetical protein
MSGGGTGGLLETIAQVGLNVFAPEVGIAYDAAAAANDVSKKNYSGAALNALAGAGAYAGMDSAAAAGADASLGSSSAAGSGIAASDVGSLAPSTYTDSVLANTTGSTSAYDALSAAGDTSSTLAGGTAGAAGSIDLSNTGGALSTSAAQSGAGSSMGGTSAGSNLQSSYNGAGATGLGTASTAANTSAASPQVTSSDIASLTGGSNYGQIPSGATAPTLMGSGPAYGGNDSTSTALNALYGGGTPAATSTSNLGGMMGDQSLVSQTASGTGSSNGLWSSLTNAAPSSMQGTMNTIGDVASKVSDYLPSAAATSAGLQGYGLYANYQAQKAQQAITDKELALADSGGTLTSTQSTAINGQIEQSRQQGIAQIMQNAASSGLGTDSLAVQQQIQALDTQLQTQKASLETQYEQSNLQSALSALGAASKGVSSDSAAASSASSSVAKILAQLTAQSNGGE